jgi:hypothetical protein
MSNDIFEYMDGLIRTLAKKKTQWKEKVLFAVKFARWMLSNYYAKVTLASGMYLIAANILYPFLKLRSV